MGAIHSDTRLQWFGSVPEHWKTARNKNAFRVVSETVGARFAELDLLSLTLQGVKLRDMESGKGKFPASFETYQEVLPGDIVFCLFDIDETPRTVGLSGHRGMVTGAYTVVRCSALADPRYVTYFYLSIDQRKGLRPFYTGLRKVVRTDTFLNATFPLPDLDTQKAIADFLDRETTRIDQLIEKKQRFVGLLGEKLDRTVRAFVSGEVDYSNDDQRCATGIGYLPSAPKNWSVEKIGWRYEIQLGKMLDSAKQTGEHLRRYLRVADVQWGNINTADLPMMDFSPSDRKRFQLLPGDLLVNEGGSYVGRSAVWRSAEREVYYQKALHRVRPIQPKRDTADFLYFLMWFATKFGVFIAGGNQTTIDHLTAEAFGRYRFAFPSFDEQHQISKRLRSEEGKYKEISAKVDTSIHRLREFRSALVTAAVTGQIDVTTWGKQGQTDSRLDEIEENMALREVRA